jgi:glycosyltransferase involved in cell wall biosynthesis
VPVYNEVGNVARVHAQILGSISKLNRTFEIIFVDDGSNDGTLDKLKELSPAVIICLQKRYGKSCALDAAIKQAQGEVIITLDGDGQNDPLDIPEFLAKMDEGFEVVCGWRYQRNDPFEKRFVSKGAAFLRKILVKDDVHDAVCGIHAYRRRCFDGLDIYGGLHRMIPAILRWRGFKMTEIKVRHHPRVHGKSKYGWQRVIEGFRDMVYIWLWRRDPTKPVYAGHKAQYHIKAVIRN